MLAVDVVHLATAAVQVARADGVVETDAGPDRQLGQGPAGAQVLDGSHAGVDGVDEGG